MSITGATFDVTVEEFIKKFTSDKNFTADVTIDKEVVKLEDGVELSISEGNDLTFNESIIYPSSNGAILVIGGVGGILFNRSTVGLFNTEAVNQRMSFTSAINSRFIGNAQSSAGTARTYIYPRGDVVIDSVDMENIRQIFFDASVTSIDRILNLRIHNTGLGIRADMGAGRLITFYNLQFTGTFGTYQFLTEDRNTRVKLINSMHLNSNLLGYRSNADLIGRIEMWETRNTTVGAIGSGSELHFWDKNIARIHNLTADVNGEFATLEVLTKSPTHADTSGGINTGYESMVGMTEVIAAYGYNLLVTEITDVNNVAIGTPSEMNSGVNLPSFAVINQNLNITTDEATVAAYTGINVAYTSTSSEAGIITISTAVTLKELYHYLHYATRDLLNTRERASIGGSLSINEIVSVSGKTVDVGTWDIVLTSTATLTTDNDWSVIQTSGLITINTGGLLSVEFLDSAGDALITVEPPQSWSVEGIYGSQADALAGTSQLYSGGIFKYLVATSGGNKVWARVEDSDGEGLGVDSYDLPLVRGIYEAAAITTTEESILSQIRSGTRENKQLLTDITTEQYTSTAALADKTELMDTSKRAPYIYVGGCPTLAANGTYRLMSVQEIDQINTYNIDSNLSVSATAVIDRTLPCYGLNNNRWLLCSFVGDIGFKVCQMQGNTNYYSCFLTTYALSIELASDPTVDKIWYENTGKFTLPSDGTEIATMQAYNTQTLVNEVLDVVNQITFDDGRINAQIPDQLTESEFDSKQKSGFQK